MTPKISLIIPVFNAQSNLRKCLAAVCNQTSWEINRDYEIIVVDDGSTDESVKIAKQFPVKLVRFRNNKGRLSARLAGAKRARSSQLLFIDTRVIICHNSLSKLWPIVNRLKSHKKTPVIMAGSNLATLEKHGWSRFFYLFRRIYYGNTWWPIPQTSHWINQTNFRLVPKGFGYFSIPKQLFIKLNQDIARQKLTLNDDTAILWHLVTKHKLQILRYKPLTWVYLPRKKLADILTWLYHRGTMRAELGLLSNKPNNSRYYSNYRQQKKHLLPILKLNQSLVFPIEKPSDLPLLLALLPLLTAAYLGGYLQFTLQNKLAKSDFLINSSTKNYLIFLLQYLKRIFPWATSLFLLIIGVIYLGKNRESLTLLSQLNLNIIVILLTLSSLFIISNSLFLAQVLQLFNVRLSTKAAIGITTANALANLVFPKGGLAIKAVILKKQFGVSYKKYLATLGFSYLIAFGVTVAMFITIIALNKALNNQLLGIAWPEALQIKSSNILTCLIFAVLLVSLSLLILKSKQKILFNSLLILKHQIVTHYQVIINLSLLATINNLLTAAQFWFIFEAFNSTLQPAINFSQAIFFTCVSALAVLVGFTPGNLGIKEAFITISSNWLNFYPPAALLASLIDRLVNTLTPLLFIPWVIKLIQPSKHQREKL